MLQAKSKSVLPTLIAVAVLLVAALRFVPQLTLIVGDWAELSIRQQIARQIAAQQGKTVSDIDAAELASGVDRVVQSHPAEIASARDALRQSLRGAITFQGEDGRRHRLLGGYDGYYWLRLARTYLQRGTVCNRSADNQCLDAETNAPIGRSIDYVHSPFVMLIAGMHWLASRFSAGLPLSTTAMLVPLLLSCLGVIPCFLLGRRIAGSTAGFIASLIVFLNAAVFSRTADADNDIMVVTLPLFALWLLAEALGQSRRPATSILAALAGVTLGLLAATWGGWPLFALSALAGLVAIFVLGFAKGSKTTGFDAGLAAVAALAGFAAVIWLFDVPIHFAEITDHLLGTLRLGGPSAARLDTAPGADMFATVGELVPVDVATFVKAVGPLGLALGFVGLPLAIAPPTRWPLRVWAAALALSAVLVLAGIQFGLGREGMLAGLAVVSATAVSALWLGRGSPLSSPQFASILCTAWLGATLVTGSQAQRFVFLAVVPLGLSAGVAVGLLLNRLMAAAARRAWQERMAGAAIAVLGLLVVTSPAIEGYHEARGSFPRLNEAWIENFAAIEQTAAPDAIIHSWWDYGHWITYFSGRRVITDGTSLRDRTVQWAARALAASGDKETIAVLRMLECGSVKDPETGTRERPYEMLIKWGNDEALAYRTILDLMRLPANEAESYLAAQGLSPARAKALAATVYCRPPEGYLLLSSELLGLGGPLVAGFWDPYYAHVLALSRRFPRERAIAAIKARFALADADAQRLYGQAMKATIDAKSADFIAPDARIWMSGWQDCIDKQGQTDCLLNLAGGARLEVQFAASDITTMHVALRTGDGAQSDVVPALVAVALSDRLAEIKPAGVTLPDLGLLIDPTGRRAFAGTPGMIRSTLARLVLLDGRYSPMFQKTSDRIAFNGERVTTWRIGWDDSAPASAAPGSAGP